MTSMHTPLVTDVVEQALFIRRGTVHIASYTRTLRQTPGPPTNVGQAGQAPPARQPTRSL